MKTKLGIAAAVVSAAVAVWFVSDYLAFFNLTPAPESAEITAVADEAGSKESAESVSYEIETVVAGLEVPWSIVFTSSERMLVAERPGSIRAVINQELQQEPLYTFADISSTAEEGLMGMALHPEYDQNQWLYACYAYPADGALKVRVVRLIDQGEVLEFDTSIIDSIPAARFHAGCELGFGPDGKLYITTGDAIDRDLAQDLNSLAGKILRINDDGSIPEDNPIANSVIYSYGHRNSQGIAWDSAGRLWSVEHGPSGFDGPGGGDELNLIVAGDNYGWPLVSHEKTLEGTTAPLVTWTPAIAPGSVAVFTSDVLPQFAGDLFVAGLRGEGLYRVEVVDDIVVRWEKMTDIAVGRVREVVVGPDGVLYFTTSNRDGRGDAASEDDRILRLVPAAL